MSAVYKICSPLFQHIHPLNADIQKILGHSSLEITQNYLNLLVSDIQKEVEEFNILREFKREGIKMR